MYFSFLSQNTIFHWESNVCQGHRHCDLCWKGILYPTTPSIGQKVEWQLQCAFPVSHVRFLHRTWGFHRKQIHKEAESKEQDRRQPAREAGGAGEGGGGRGQLTGHVFFFFFCLLFYLDEWNTFSYKNDLKWITLYNEQVEPFFFLF